MSEAVGEKVGDEEFRQLIAKLQTEGRELAEGFLRSAVEKSTDLHDMNCKLTVLRAAALSLLAHDVYNTVEQGMGTKVEAVDRALRALIEEAEMIFEHPDEPEILIPESGKH